MKRYLLSILMVLVSVSVTCSADKPNVNTKYPKSSDKTSPDPNSANGAQNYKFSSLKLRGHLMKPELNYTYQRDNLQNEQIVEIPEDFNDQIIKSAGQF